MTLFLYASIEKNLTNINKLNYAEIYLKILKVIFDFILTTYFKTKVINKYWSFC